MDEAELERICKTHEVDRVVFAYSDSRTPRSCTSPRARSPAAPTSSCSDRARTMLRSRRPVIAVSAVRTGCGKSQTSRWIVRRLARAGLRVAALRHPMPYGDLERQRVQRFATRADLEAADCTIEEREEYEPYVAAGAVVFAGVDYAEILARAEADADVLVWDGGNNDFPFLWPGPAHRHRRCAAPGPGRRRTTRARRCCGWPTSSS